MYKKPYQAPRLSRFGHIEEIMGAFGGHNAVDTIFNADGTIRGDGDGGTLADGIVVPCGEQPPRYECG